MNNPYKPGTPRHDAWERGANAIASPAKSRWLVMYQQDGMRENHPLPVYAKTIYEAAALAAEWPYGHRVVGIMLDE